MKARPVKDRRTIVFVTFETEFAKSGGLGAVMGILPGQMAQREKCIAIGPYFKRITDLAKLQADKKIREYCPLSSFQFSTEKKVYTVEVTEVISLDGFRTYLLSSAGFFTAPADPYVNPVNPTQALDPYTNPNRPEKLVEDTLFFCAVVPKVLVHLGMTKDLILQLQDWEAACAIQAIKNENEIGPAACVLTLHNPYDKYLDRNNSSSEIHDLMAYLKLNYDNILAQTMALVDGPLSTVSQNFADELMTSPLHHDVFAGHLQKLFEGKGLIGIDNGLFGDLKFPFSEQAHEQARAGNYEGIQQEKWDRREELGKVIESYQHELAASSKESWGADLDLSDPSVPVFLIMGRDDPRQKGFDVAAAAIRMIPEGKARYIFTPHPGDEGLLGLDFLKKLAQDRPGEVKAFPFRMTPELFKALQFGSSFMVMCSLYEPFGAATEAYLAGMPVVARATGGLIQQVVPYPGAALSRYGRQLAALFHDRNDPPTGFLFREPETVDERQDWQKIVDCEYWNWNPKGDRVENRTGISLFDAMVQRAAWAFQDAIDLYTSDQAGYAEMIYNGFKLLDRFSWERAIREYQCLYDRVCS
ncbi:MAG TPA: glycogen/starch synthase [Anaerolineales bacterium]|nr:glycogen/starch synthase [Anaerolineales bacterium]